MVLEPYYACLDLKSFYASVECVERGLDPFTTDLVVADESRGPGAITLAITPSLKAKGIKNRCRLYEIPSHLNYLIIKPHMKKYMEYSAKIYDIYLQYFAPKDIYIYSIDECFIYLTPYLKLYNSQPLALTKKLMEHIKADLGLCTTGGVGKNLFQAKVALDITAKHSPNHLGYIDESNFQEKIATHKPITDIWGIGKGTAKKLARYGVNDLAGITKLPEFLLKKLFGINYRILLEHAHGKENTTITEIKSYIPKEQSISTSQILFYDYPYYDAWQLIQEMLDNLTLELVKEKLSTRQITLDLRYQDSQLPRKHLSHQLKEYTHSYHQLKKEFATLFFNNVLKTHKLKQIGISLGHLKHQDIEQLSLFSNHNFNKEDNIQKTILNIKNQFGKNAIFRASSLQKHATALQRNKLIGGHNGE